MNYFEHLPIWERTTALDRRETLRAFAVASFMLVSYQAKVNSRETPSDKTARIEYVGPNSEVRRLVFRPDGKTAVSYYADRSLHYWDALTGKRLRVLEPDNMVSEVIAISSSTLKVATYDLDFRIRLWDIQNGKATGQLADRFVNLSGAAFSRDGHQIAVSTQDSVCVCDVTTGKVTQRLPEGTLPHSAASFSPDGKTIAYASDNVILWDLVTQRKGRAMSAKGGRPLFSPDGSLLAIMGPNNVTYLCEVATGKLVRTCRGANRLCFSPDGRILASFQPGAPPAFWDMVTANLLNNEERYALTGDALAFSPDGKSIAMSTHGKNKITIWDLKSVLGNLILKRISLTRPELNKLWDNLADEDAYRAFRAMFELVSAPTEAVGLLGEHLKPVPSMFDNQVRRLVQDLDSADFRMREKALTQLGNIGGEVSPALAVAWRERPSPEQKRLLDTLLNKLISDNPNPELFQRTRAYRVLELIGSVPARQLLNEMRAGAFLAASTQIADATFKRLPKP